MNNIKRKSGQVWATPLGTIEFELVSLDGDIWTGRVAKTGCVEYAAESEFEGGCYRFVRDWRDYLPTVITPGLIDKDAVKVGQIYASCWMTDSKYARLWRVTDKGDQVLVGMNEGVLFGNKFAPTTSCLRYDNAVLIADVGEQPRKFIEPQQIPPEKLSFTSSSVEVTAGGDCLCHYDINSKYPKINPPLVFFPFAGDPLRTALEKKLADADGVPTCVTCGARGPVGRSLKCHGCWARGRGATAEVMASHEPRPFVSEVDDFDLLPPA